MTEIEESKRAGHTSRRTILKGAAWSVPVVVAAVATPLATASVAVASLSIYDDCLLNVSGVKIGRGFYVKNSGNAAYASTITVTETIVLSGAAALPPVKQAVWGVLAVQGILGGGTTGVNRGAWSGNNSSTTRSRTVTITAPLAAGATRSWGVALDAITGVINILGLLGLADITHTATISTPTGNPPVTDPAAEIDWALISGSC